MSFRREVEGHNYRACANIIFYTILRFAIQHLIFCCAALGFRLCIALFRLLQQQVPHKRKRLKNVSTTNCITTTCEYSTKIKSGIREKKVSEKFRQHTKQGKTDTKLFASSEDTPFLYGSICGDHANYRRRNGGRHPLENNREKEEKEACELVGKSVRHCYPMLEDNVVEKYTNLQERNESHPDPKPDREGDLGQDPNKADADKEEVGPTVEQSTCMAHAASFPSDGSIHHIGEPAPSVHGPKTTSEGGEYEQEERCYHPGNGDDMSQIFHYIR